MAPDARSRMRKRKGRSARKSGVNRSRSQPIVIDTVVAAAASVPFSLTSMHALCPTPLLPAGKRGAFLHRASGYRTIVAFPVAAAPSPLAR